MNEKNKKQRLDILLVERGLFTARDKAKAAIMAGEVLVNGQKADKSGAAFAFDVSIELTGDKLPYVSRGGLKLAHAIGCFGLGFSGKTVLDIGSSTGGFVDCALQNGAQKVYSVDVGYGQLAWKLRTDSRVVVLEKTNARYLTCEQIPESVDFLTVDASFISLAKILPAPSGFLKKGGILVALVKPQFEAGRENVGKKGVVRDQLVHKKVLREVCAAVTQLSLSLRGLDFSPLLGPEGNMEFLLWAQKEVTGFLTAAEAKEFDEKEIEIKVEEVIVAARSFHFGENS